MTEKRQVQPSPCSPWCVVFRDYPLDKWDRFVQARKWCQHRRRKP